MIAVEITRYGQSAVLLEAQGTRVLVDPGNLSGDEVFELESLDAVLFTHEHPDHCDPDRVPELLSASPNASVYAPPPVLEMLGVSEQDRGRAVSDGEVFEVGPFSIEAVGELHQLIVPQVPRCANVGFVLSDGTGARVFLPGDSYETTPTGVTVLAVPLLGPWSILRETVDFVNAVSPAQMFPIHDAHLSDTGKALFWPWLQKFAREGTAGVDLAPGETLSTG